MDGTASGSRLFWTVLDGEEIWVRFLTATHVTFFLGGGAHAPAELVL